MSSLQYVVLWREQRKRLQGKKTHVTIPAETPFGKFAIMAFAEPTHPMRGGSSFLAAGGQGFLWVKRLDDDHLLSCRFARVTISGCNVEINHDFEHDGDMCRIPGLWPLGDEVRCTEMRFVFESKRVDPQLCFAVRQQVVCNAYGRLKCRSVETFASGERH